MIIREIELFRLGLGLSLGLSLSLAVNIDGASPS